MTKFLDGLAATIIVLTFLALLILMGRAIHCALVILLVIYVPTAIIWAFLRASERSDS